jgi:DNA polymerase-3 subunit gamma/tau
VDATQEGRRQMQQQAQQFEIPYLLETLRIFNSAANDERTGWQPGLALEIAFAASLEPAAQPPSTGCEARPQAVNLTPQPPAQTRLAQPVPPPTQVLPGNNPTASRPAAERQAVGDTRPAPAQTTAPQTPVAPGAQVTELKTAALGGTPVAQPGAGISLSKVVQSWPQIRALVKKRKSQTEGLLNSCKPMGIKDNMLILGFASEVLKSKMEMGDNLQITQAAIQQVLGAPLLVICTIATGKAGLSANVEVDSDGMVGTALRDLGGEIVDVV